MEPLSVAILLGSGACCGSGCRNCPYSPRHAKGTVQIDRIWIAYKMRYPDATYDEYQKKIKR